MKNGKKLTAVAAASAVASALVAPAAMAATSSFSDIGGNFAEAAIKDLATKGILSGNPDGTFNPNGNITREQFAVVLAKALNLDASGTASFSDVDSWASGYVAAVNKAGFIAGYDATHFGGKDNLTREQMATIFVRALSAQTGYKADGKGANLSFSDASSISSWAKDAVGAAVELGLIHGMTDGSFAPAGHATRAQVALVAGSFLAKVDELKGATVVSATATANADNTITVTGSTKGADSVKVSVDGNTAEAATLNADGTFTYTTGILGLGSHTFSVVAYKGDKASEAVTASASLAGIGVNSVTTPNARTIVVKFNKELDATSAQDMANYSIDGVDLTTAGVTAADVTLSTDKTTVTIDLGNATIFTQGQTFRFQVADAVTDKAGNAITAYDNLLTFNDDKAPTVASTNWSYAAKLFTVNFSEPLNVAFGSKIKVLDSGNNDVTGSIVTPALDGKSFTVDATSLTEGETYRVVMLGAKDLAGNFFDGNKVEYTFTYSQADTTAPTISSVVTKGDHVVRVTFSEPVSDLGNVTVDSNAPVAIDNTATDTDTAGNAVQVDDAGKVWDVAVADNGAGLTNGIHTVKIDSSKDLQDNVLASTYSKLLSFTADATAPAVKTQSTAGSKLFLTFDEDVTFGTDADVTVVTPDQVEQTAALVHPSTDNGATNTAVIDLTNAIVDANGSYTVSIPSGLIVDAAGNTKAYTITANFVPGDTVKPVVNAITPAPLDPNTVTVSFSEAVDTSALNVANYTVDGKNVFSSAVYTSTAKNAVKLTLKPNSYSETGDHIVKVANVKDTAGNVMNAYTDAVTLTENTAPTYTANVVDNNTIVLTTSEPVTGTGAAADYTVYINNVAVVVSGVVVDGNTITITLRDDIADLNKTVQVQSNSTNDTADDAGNAISTAKVTAKLDI